MATGNSTASPYSTAIPRTSLSAAISTLENYFLFGGLKYYYRRVTNLPDGFNPVDK